jgi:hypothetical protein
MEWPRFGTRFGTRNRDEPNGGEIAMRSAKRLAELDPFDAVRYSSTHFVVPTIHESLAFPHAIDFM